MIKRIFYITLVLIVLTMTISITASAQEYIVKMKDNGVMLFSSDVEPLYAEINLYSADEETAKALLESGRAEYIEPSGRVELFESSYEDVYATEYAVCPSLGAINAEVAWNYETFGNDVIVGVIDSGCYEHTDIKVNLLPGKNYVESMSDYDETDTNDTIGHGTHVSGIIAATLNNVGVAGAAPKAKIVPLMFTTMETYYTDTADMQIAYILKAIRDAVYTYNCSIINMSFGVATPYTSLLEALEDAYKNGVVLVAAVGNYGQYTSDNYKGTSNYAYNTMYPAGFDDFVIGVGAVNDNRQVCDFSQKNNTPDVFAPGSNVMSLDKTAQGYRTDSGTSMACPYVSAAAAIALSFDPTLTPAEVRTLITSNTESINGTWTYNNAGVLNIKKMVDALLKNREAYSSPLVKTESGISSTVFNLGETDLNASAIWYDKNSGNITEHPFTVSAEDKKIVLSSTLTSPKLFVWNSLNGMIPITQAR